MDVLLANPRGFCAGVDRAIEIVERALELFGAPIHVRHEVVHNKFVVDRLRSLGAVFVEELDEVPAHTTTEGDVVVTRRDIPGVKAPPFWQAAMRGNGLDPEQTVDRWQRCRFVPPSSVLIDVGVALAGQDAGLNVLGYTSQARFLLNCGLPALMESATLAGRTHAMKLIAEHEMGELFKVVAFCTGEPWDALGFRHGDRTHAL